MKRELKLTSTLAIDKEQKSYGSGATSFDSPKFFQKYAGHFCSKSFSGIVTVNGNPIKFSYSPYFDDGDIKSNDAYERFVVKQTVIAYVYSWILELQSQK